MTGVNLNTYVAETARVSDNAVLFNSKVDGTGSVGGRSRVVDSTVSGNARVFSSYLCSSVVERNACVSNAVVVDSTVSGNARVGGAAVWLVGASVLDDAAIEGSVFVSHGYVANAVTLRCGHYLNPEISRPEHAIQVCGLYSSRYVCVYRTVGGRWRAVAGGCDIRGWPVTVETFSAESAVAGLGETIDWSRLGPIRRRRYRNMLREAASLTKDRDVQQR